MVWTKNLFVNLLESCMKFHSSFVNVFSYHDSKNSYIRIAFVQKKTKPNSWPNFFPSHNEKVKVRWVVISVSSNSIKFLEFSKCTSTCCFGSKFIRYATVKKQSAYIRVGVIFLLQQHLIYMRILLKASCVF